MKLLGRFRLGEALAIVALAAAPVFAEASPPDPTAAQPTPAPEVIDGGDITLAQAGALALTGSPRLAVFALERRIRDARALQASLRPNPELALEVENFAGSGELAGFGGSELTLSVAQLFELGGKRSNRRASRANWRPGTTKPSASRSWARWRGPSSRWSPPSCGSRSRTT